MSAEIQTIELKSGMSKSQLDAFADALKATMAGGRNARTAFILSVPDQKPAQPSPEVLSKRGPDDWRTVQAERLDRCRRSTCKGCAVCGGRFHRG